MTESTSTTRPASAQALQALEENAVFERSAGLLRLLRFLIDASENDPEAMKETYVGTAFYNRDATYDPRYDSIVRVNVMRLRQRLAEYYAGPGANDRVTIEIPRGSYVPVITVKPAPVYNRRAADLAPPAPPAPPVALPHTEPGSVAARRRRRLLLWAVSAALVLLGALILHLLSNSRHHSLPGFVGAVFEQVPLTPGRDLEFEPATSPDGKQLAFVTRAPSTANFQIFLRAFVPDGKPDRTLQTGPENAFYPAWSPDGKQLAFLRCGLGPCDVATVPVAGGPVHPVETLPTYSLPDDQPYYQYRQLQPIWAPDGQGLIFPYRGLQDNAERLVLLDLATGTRHQLSFGAPSDEDAAPTLSPDHTSVAFLRRHLDHTQVMTLNLKTLRTQVLETEPYVTPSGLTWSPDGQGVVVGINRRKGTTLLWVPLQGTPAVLNVDKLPFVMNPVFSADGKTLMVLSVNRSRNLAAVSPDSPQPQTIFPSKLRNAATAFSPDTRQIAFLSDRSGAFEVWIARRSGTTFLPPRQLTHGLGWYPSSIAWSPDAQTLAVGISNTNHIEMVDTQSGAISALRLPGLKDSVTWSPVWSGDGHSLYLTASGEKNGIFRASTTPVPAVHQIYSGSAREIRIDGDRALYFTMRYARGIYRLPLRGADASPQLVPALRDVLASRAWGIADGNLYYCDVHDPTRRLHLYNLATGTIHEATGSLPRIAFLDGTLSFAPQANLLTYSEWAEAAGSQIIALRWR
jgi:Tol biopolymer transport system component